MQGVGCRACLYQALLGGGVQQPSGYAMSHPAHLHPTVVHASGWLVDWFGLSVLCVAWCGDSVHCNPFCKQHGDVDLQPNWSATSP